MMIKNTRTFQQSLKFGAFATIFTFSMGIGQVFAQTKIEDDFEEHESKRKRQEYLEKIHRAAPGTDWQNQDQKARIANYNALKGKAHLKTAGGAESLAGGNLTGVWVEKGANNVAGRVRHADYAASTNSIYAVSDGGNVWKSNISGSNWTCLNNGFKLKGSEYIKVIPNGTTNRIIVGTNDKYIYYSDNDGATWNQSTGFPNVIYWGWMLQTQVMADAANTIYVLAIENSGGEKVAIYRSTDKGTSFTRLREWTINYGNADQDKFSLYAPNNASHTQAYIINQDSVFSVASTGSNAVTRIAKHNLTVNTGVRLTGNKSGSTIYLYASTNDVIYKSANGGTSWTQLNAPNPGKPFGGSNCFSTSLSDPNKIYWGDVHSFIGVVGASTITWTKTNDWGEYYGDPLNKLHADIPGVVSLKDASNNEFQLICTDGGIYYSNNFLSTVKNISISGMNNAQYYSVYTLKNKPGYVFAGAQDQGIQQGTSDSGGLLNLQELISGDNGRTVSTDNNSVWQTGYGDLYYYPVASNGTNIAYYSLNGVGKLWMAALTEHPTIPTTMYMGGGKTDTDPTAKIYQFTYSAGSISKTSLSYDFAPSSGCTNISAVGISKLNNNYWYVLTDNGRFFSSTNGGSSFTMNSTFGGPAGHYFYGSTIWASKNTLGTLYIAGSGYSNPGVYKSTDHGQTFTAISNGLPSTMIFDIVANDDESMLFAATELGAYVYIASTNTWYSMLGSSGADQTYWDADYISTQKIVRFATYGRGIWDFQIQSGTNPYPSVSITSPINNTFYTLPASVTIQATATDADGTVSKVEFYNGDVKLGEDATSPYTYTISTLTTDKYNLWAKAIDNSGKEGYSQNVIIAGLRNADNPTGTTSGLNYSYYEGTWDVLPDFSALTPIKTGNVSTFNLSPRNRDDQFGFKYVGYIDVPTDGIYRFSTSSDDGSRLYIGSTIVIDNDGIHGTNTVAKEIGLKAGKHAITVIFFENSGGEALTVNYEGPGLFYQVIPASALYRDATLNATPQVSITSPTNNSTITGTSVTINATATDSDGTISKVEFYQGSTKIDEDLTSPYSITWTTTAGTYALTARATDNLGAVGVSSTVNITVSTGSTCTDPAWDPALAYSGGSKVSYNGRKYTANYWNQNVRPDLNCCAAGKEWADNGACTGATNVAPTVSLTAPANNATYTAPASVTLSATASDSDGSISKVEFYYGTTYIGDGVLNAGTYSYSWYNVVAGTYTITAKAYDNLSASTVSSSSSITVTNPTNPAPTVSLTAPANGASFNAPATITLKATASDDGSISKVEFYNGSILLGNGTLTAGEYVYNWLNVAVGSYSITAKAYDNLNASTVSSARSCSVVNPAPTVSITSPTTGTNYATAPASVTMTATASDNGSISKVEFYQGTTFLGNGTLSAGVYSYTWTSVAAGTYSLTAKAYDNLNAITTSSAVSISVGSGGCSSPQYVENGGYVAGSNVKNNGVEYECKPYPYTSWCNGAAWAYAPGTGSYWSDAWIQKGACKTGSFEADENVLLMYPNPASYFVNISLNSESEGVVTLTVSNELSKDLLTKVVSVKAGSNLVELNLKDLENGVYVLKIENGGKVISKKLSVVR